MFLWYHQYRSCLCVYLLAIATSDHPRRELVLLFSLTYYYTSRCYHMQGEMLQDALPTSDTPSLDVQLD